MATTEIVVDAGVHVGATVIATVDVDVDVAVIVDRIVGPNGNVARMKAHARTTARNAHLRQNAQLAPKRATSLLLRRSRGVGNPVLRAKDPTKTMIPSATSAAREKPTPRWNHWKAPLTTSRMTTTSMTMSVTAWMLRPLRATWASTAKACSGRKAGVEVGAEANIVGAALMAVAAAPVVAGAVEAAGLTSADADVDADVAAAVAVAPPAARTVARLGLILNNP